MIWRNIVPLSYWCWICRVKCAAHGKGCTKAVIVEFPVWIFQYNIIKQSTNWIPWLLRNILSNLSILKELIELHVYNLWLTSKLHKGVALETFMLSWINVVPSIWTNARGIKNGQLLLQRHQFKPNGGGTRRLTVIKFQCWESAKLLASVLQARRLHSSCHSQLFVFWFHPTKARGDRHAVLLAVDQGKLRYQSQGTNFHQEHQIGVTMDFDQGVGIVLQPAQFRILRKWL